MKLNRNIGKCEHSVGMLEFTFDSCDRIHWELFPDNRPLEKHLHELRDTVLHAVGGMREKPLVRRNFQCSQQRVNRFNDIADFNRHLEYRGKYDGFEPT